MSNYDVVWAIDVDNADSPIAAAKEARQAQVRPGTTAVVFKVTDKATGDVTLVDLEDCPTE